MQQGILSKNMAPKEQAQPAQQTPQQRPQQNPEQGPQGDDVPNKQVEILTNAMLGALYGPALKSTSNMLKQEKDKPEQAIGRVLSGLMITTQQKLTEDNKDVPPGAMFASAMVAAQAVGEMAERMGVIPKGGNGEVIEAGFMLGMAKFGKATKGMVSPEKRQQYGQMIQALTEGRKRSMGSQQPAEGRRPQGGKPQAMMKQQPRGAMQ